VQKSAYNKKKKEIITKGDGLPNRKITIGAMDEIKQKSKYQSLLNL